MTNLKSNVMWSAVRNWANRLGTIAVFLVLARILSTHELGLFSAVLAIMAIAEIFAENGIGDAVVQARRIDDGILSAGMIVNTALSLALATGLIVFAGPIQQYFQSEGLAPLLQVTSLTLVINALCYVPQSLFRRNFEYRWLAVRALVATGVSGALGIAMALMGYGAWSMVAQALTFAVFNFAMTWVRAPFNPFVRPAFREAAGILVFGGQVLLGRLLYYGATRLVELILLFKYSPAVLSLYIIGSRIYFVATQLLTQVLVDVALASFSRLADEKEQLEKVFYQTLSMATVLTAPAFWGLSAVAPELCSVAFGDKGPEAAPFLQVVGFFGAMQVSSFFFGSVLTALGRPMLPTFILVVQCALSLFVLLPPWPLDSVQLIAVNSALSFVILPLYIVICARAGGFHVGRIISAIAPAYGAALIMYGCVYFARGGLSTAVTSPFFRGAILATVGAVAYGAALLVFAPSVMRMLLNGEFVKRLRKAKA